MYVASTQNMPVVPSRICLAVVARGCRMVTSESDEVLAKHRRGADGRRMRAFRAESGTGRQLRPALAAPPDHWGGTFFAELRAGAVLMVAPTTLHARHLQPPASRVELRRPHSIVSAGTTSTRRSTPPLDASPGTANALRYLGAASPSMVNARKFAPLSRIGISCL